MKPLGSAFDDGDGDVALTERRKQPGHRDRRGGEQIAGEHHDEVGVDSPERADDSPQRALPGVFVWNEAVTGRFDRSLVTTDDDDRINRSIREGGDGPIKQCPPVDLD